MTKPTASLRSDTCPKSIGMSVRFELEQVPDFVGMHSTNAPRRTLTQERIFRRARRGNHPGNGFAVSFASRRGQNQELTPSLPFTPVKGTAVQVHHRFDVDGVGPQGANDGVREAVEVELAVVAPDFAPAFRAPSGFGPVWLDFPQENRRPARAAAPHTTAQRLPTPAGPQDVG